MKNGIIVLIFLCALELLLPTTIKAEVDLIKNTNSFFQLKGVGACSGGGSPEPEVCDYIDNDCDGAVDNNAIDAIEWCRDLDEDTFGNPLINTFECVQPTGYVENCGDCDDNDPNTGGGCAIVVFINGFESNPP